MHAIVMISSSDMPKHKNLMKASRDGTNNIQSEDNAPHHIGANEVERDRSR